MKQKILIIISLIICLEIPLFSQLKYNFSQFTDETLDFIKQPGNWRGEDFLNIGLISAGTGATMFADQSIRDWIQKDQRYYYSVPIVGGRVWGELYTPCILFSGFAIYSLITEDDWSRKVAFEIGQASLYAGGLTFLLKMGIGRARPYLDLGPGTYRPFLSVFNQDYHSLPGGHSTAAFTISTILARNAKPLWLKVLCYTPAAFTFISRIYQDQHWTSDNFMGAALGYFVATWVVDQHEKKGKRKY